MQIKTPDLGVERAEVAEIMVKVGDSVKKDDNLVLVESDKASVEIPSPFDGVIDAILVQKGDIIGEGLPLFKLKDVDSQPNSLQADSEQSSQPSSQSPTKPDLGESTQLSSPITPSLHSFSLPDLGVDSAQVAEVLVQVGDVVEKDASLLLLESDKASVEVPAPMSGQVEQILVNLGDTVTNGQVFVVIREQAMSTPTPNTPNSEPQSATETPITNTVEPYQDKPLQVAQQNQPQQVGKLDEHEINNKVKNIYAGPAVRKLARKMGIDISAVKGSAVHGRIIKEDLFEFVKHIVQNVQNQEPKPVASVNTGSGISLPPLPDMSNAQIWGEIEIQALTRLQKVSIPQLNLNTLLPQVTQFDLADISDTEAMRNELKGEFKAQGISLTILAFIIKAVAYALTKYSKFNSHVSDDNTQLIVRKSVHMGIAVATDDGLIVPVIQDAQDKGIKQLAIEIGELAKKARDKKLTAKELQGASFTISSQGNLGGTYFTPLVNHPQVAILGVSESTMHPRWNGKEFEPRLMLPLSLSYDHRAINGADAAVFTRFVAQLLADPRKILL